ncbi:MAG: TonB-dependent receptor, partial [Alphaproteobacteria bacterium]|nr:TonB-dependent receptor [Alphaproteobacteria bacterium]
QEENIRSSRAGTHGEQGIETYGSSLRVDYHFDGMDFSSITGFREEKSYNTEDNDRAPERSGEAFSEQSTWTLSQEFRFVSIEDGALTMGGKLSWAAGLYWFHEEGTRLQGRYSNFFGPGGLQGPGSPEVQQSISTWDTAITTDALAVFGQASYALTEMFSITGGLRYTYEKKDFTVDTNAVPLTAGGNPYSLFLPNGPFSTQVAESWGRVTPHVGLEAQLDEDIFAYAIYSHGFKSGGFDGQSGGPNLAPFKHERVVNYEIGVKARFFDGKLQTNISAFYADFKDLQQQGFSETGLPITSNAADARVQGLEVEIDVRPLENLTISGGLSLMDTEYSDYFIKVFDPTIVGGPPFRLVDKSGDRIGLTPKYSYNLRVLYAQPLDNGSTVNFQADLVGVSNTITEFNTLWSNSYDVVNARITWVSADESWEAGLWVKNITDEEYYRGGGPVPDLNDQIARLGLVADPRTYGLTIKWRFGE